MARGKKTGGRKRGTPNKRAPTGEQLMGIREAFVWAFNNIGAQRGLTGAEALVEWASANRSEFYKLAARLLPIEMVGDPNKPITIITRAE